MPESMTIGMPSAGLMGLLLKLFGREKPYFEYEVAEKSFWDTSARSNIHAVIYNPLPRSILITYYPNENDGVILIQGDETESHASLDLKSIKKTICNDSVDYIIKPKDKIHLFVQPRGDKINKEEDLCFKLEWIKLVNENRWKIKFLNKPTKIYNSIPKARLRKLLGKAD